MCVECGAIQQRRKRRHSAHAFKHVVGIRIGHIWCSGVIVSKMGHIITTAHAFRNNCVGNKVQVLRNAILWEDASIMYCSTIIDLAILIIDIGIKIVPMNIELPKIGASIFGIGYGMKKPILGARPIMVSGKISDLGHEDKKVTMICTTAPFYGGASGGGLFDTSVRIM